MIGKKSDRIPCINPSCRRTAAAVKHPPGTEVVCSKCWKLLPARLKDRYRALKRRRRSLERRASRRDIKPPVRVIDRAQEQNWSDIRAYYLSPAEPVGLDAFLDEVGLA